ncbi:hypothetical protein B0O99DRAFT_650378 [Bisporella sp. PMI_857]|nr:hypothetical protein B0O99DRAFT_650378 [Bisporella sp. PMI_857]
MPYDVVIIGAGFYGLVAARNYLRLRPQTNLLIIDSNTTAGGVWCKERLYPNLVAQVPIGFFNYADTPMDSEAGAPQDSLIPGSTIYNYLQKYAEIHNLLHRIRFSSVVTGVERCSTGWKLHCDAMGSIVLLETVKLIVATGVTSIPVIPKFRAQNVSLPIIHSKELGVSIESLRNPVTKTVVVVGARKSAYDTVHLLLTLGKKIIWIIRPDGTGPHPLIPRKVLGYWSSIGVSSTRFMSYVSPSILNVGSPLQTFFQRTVLGRWCTGMFWDALTYLSHHHAGYHKGDHVSLLKPDIEEKSVFWGDSGVGLVTLPDFWEKIHNGDITVLRDKIEAIENNTLSLESAEQVKADYIVMCTGWGDHFQMFEESLKLELGLPCSSESKGLDIEDSIPWKKYNAAAEMSVNYQLPFLTKPPARNYPHMDFLEPKQSWRLYRRVVPLSCAQREDRSIIILGQIHTIQTPLVADIQSFWGILYLLGEIELPNDETLAKEVCEWNAWTRKRYLSQGLKSPYSLFDFLPYLDSLCRDMGLNSNRKNNFISEIFSPYKPEDFNGFIDEYLEFKKSKDRET